MVDERTVGRRGVENERSEGVYLFCLARRGAVLPMQERGVDGRNAVFLWRCDDLVAVISPIYLEEFCGDWAESRMQDLSWVGPRAWRHEEIVEQVMRSSPVLPLPFGTIFSSLASLQKTVERHGGAITRFLDWVADKEEWGVKGVLNRAKAKEAILSGILDQHGERLASLSPGARYFEEERIRRRSEKELKQWLEEICGKAADNLRRGSSGFRERKVPCGTGGDTDVVVNWAFLLPGNYVTEFRAEVDRVNEGQAKQGLVFEVSGPWPPYSFCPCLEEEQER